jgi:hypothetical protein
MKRIIVSIAAIVVSVYVFAQAPQKISYQAVIREAGNALVTNHAIGMRITILQGSFNGNIVYTETQTPITNINGLVTIEIGGGTGFDAIDWSAGPYFIRTETDPAGGTNYTTIVGTSQLLSVPFALYSKTADNITGTVAVVNGGTGSSSVAGAKVSLELSNVDNTTDLNKPVSIATQTALDSKAPLASPVFTGIPLAATATAGTNNTQIATTAFVSSELQNKVPAHYIGESYGGGIVFYVYDNGQHGLIAATSDQSTGLQWYNGTNIMTLATRNGIGAGRYNTELIINRQGYGVFAASKCAWYSGGNYGDWYLPSRYELNLLYLQKNVVGGFQNYFYWSSCEVGDYDVFGQEFSDGSQHANGRDEHWFVRAIRAF